jgi:hypothetical protein
MQLQRVLLVKRAKPTSCGYIWMDGWMHARIHACVFVCVPVSVHTHKCSQHDESRGRTPLCAHCRAEAGANDLPAFVAHFIARTRAVHNELLLLVLYLRSRLSCAQANPAAPLHMNLGSPSGAEVKKQQMQVSRSDTGASTREGLHVAFPENALHRLHGSAELVCNYAYCTCCRLCVFDAS